MNKLINIFHKGILATILLVGFTVFSFNAFAQLPYSNGFESADPTCTDDVVSGYGTITQPSTSGTIRTGTNAGYYVSGGSGGSSGRYDGSIITELITFTAGKY